MLRSNEVIVILFIVAIVLISITGWYLALNINIELDDGSLLKASFGQSIESVLKQANFNSSNSCCVQIGEEGLLQTVEKPQIFFNGQRTSLKTKIYCPGKLSVLVRKVKFTSPATSYRTIEKPAIVSGKGPFLKLLREGLPAVIMREKEERLYFSYEKVVFEGLTPLFERTDGVKEKAIALTFDDGPSLYTLSILRILERYGIKATFFMIGKHIERYPQIVKQVASKGHLIGNHSYNHLKLKGKPESQLDFEVNKTAILISKLTSKNCYWFRPPMGSFDYNLISYLRAKNYQISLWTVDSVDWKDQNPYGIYKRVISNLNPGDVILLHDGGGPRHGTVQATEMIIKTALKRGFVFVTLADFSKIRARSNASL
jgi:peptidoglycan/xylan/chitin deacetylase (PgdA/CDA1 family)